VIAISPAYHDHPAAAAFAELPGHYPLRGHARRAVACPNGRKRRKSGKGRSTALRPSIHPRDDVSRSRRTFVHLTETEVRPALSTGELRSRIAGTRPARGAVSIQKNDSPSALTARSGRRPRPAEMRCWPCRRRRRAGRDRWSRFSGFVIETLTAILWASFMLGLSRIACINLGVSADGCGIGKQPRGLLYF